MPGIVGMISQRPAEDCEPLVKAMTDSMKHESSYDSGTYSVPEMGIYAGWVAHKNSFAAGQVFFNEQKDIALLFSGECFVDRETRNELKQKGHELGRADGDWIVHLYEEGERFFEKLNGLFNGLLIDKRQGKAFLFNDRYGVQRIYWHETNDAIYFASETKALLRILPQLRTFDQEGVAEFLTFGCTLGQRTLFRGVHLLSGGSLWSFDNGKCHKGKYFSSETWESQPILSVESFEDRFRETFKRVLPRYFESESNIGISLTGGLDSRVIMACMPDTAQEPVCYTFSGEKGLTLDDRLAARVAKACGLQHQLLRLAPDFFSDFASNADKTVYVTDGCFGITGAHEVYLNKLARRLAPIRLAGVFGGEIFRGVSTFKPIGLSPLLVNPEFRSNVDWPHGPIANGKTHPVTFAAFKEAPWRIFGSLTACGSQVTLRTPYLDNELVALAYRMPEHFRRSSLPASRVIKANSEALSEIPTDRGFADGNSGLRFWLRRFAAESTFKIDYYNSEGLPFGLSLLDSVFRRVSSGLGLLGLHKYLPYRHWFRRELADYINDRLRAARDRQMPFWNSDLLANMAREHVRGRKNYVREINAVLTLEAVERLLIRTWPT